MRMQIIYGPDGRAGEYARDALATNLYKGCAHGCVYCSAPGTLRQTPKEFHSKVEPKERAVERFTDDLIKLKAKGITGRIFMSFVCDPYPGVEADLKITRQAILAAHKHGFGVDILTKSNLAYWDLPLLGENDSLGVTLTTMSPALASVWEPNACDPVGRAFILQLAHDRGIETWVSCEPVIDPAATFEVIRATHAYVNRYKVGKLNYEWRLPAEMTARILRIDWRQFAVDVKQLLEELNCEYYLKDDLRKLLPEVQG